MKPALTLAICLLTFGSTSLGQDPTRHWAYRPLQQRAFSHGVSAWVRNSVDRFVDERLHSEYVRPSPPANAATLLRRLKLDLLGLLPTPEETAAYRDDFRPDAYARRVDRFLASPHYGEKWARGWLDLCHYADSDGYLTDQLRPVAWRYRDWLVAALNANLPFDRFTIDQLAGDVRPNATMSQKLATGFLRQTLSNREGGADLEEFRVLQVVDRTQMVGATWLGLTVGCARCHDHKYDALTQREFFQLYACFNNADEVNVDAPLAGERKRFLEIRPKYLQQRSKILAPIAAPLRSLQDRWERRLLRAYRRPGEDAHWDRQWELLGLIWGGGKGEGQLEGCEIVKLPLEQRSQRQRNDLLDYFLGHSGNIDPAEFKRLKLAERSRQLRSLRQPPATRAATMRAAQTPRPTYIHVRGDFRDRGADARPGIPRSLSTAAGELPVADASGRHVGEAFRGRTRLALARWLVSGRNPLPPRVTVNRMWQEFFGAGLVRTPDDFGIRGERPTHPLLLDWLASEFVRHGWDVKSMHTMLVNSATYRQSSRQRAELLERDPENRWWARQNRFRLSAETLRDVTLAVSGLWDRRLGGPSVFPPQPTRVIKEAFGNHEWKISSGGNRYRRAVYTFVQRTAPFAQGAIFDAPNPNETCTQRERSNTPLQALTLLNDEAFFETAQALARRAIEKIPSDKSLRLDFVFQRVLCRLPNAKERTRLLRLATDLQREAPNAGTGTEAAAVAQFAWTGVCSVLLNLHEFVTRD